VPAPAGFFHASAIRPQYSGATLSTISRRLANVGIVALAAIGPSVACSNESCKVDAGQLGGGVQVTAPASVGQYATKVMLCVSDRCVTVSDGGAYGWRSGTLYPFPFSRKDLLVDEQFNTLAVGRKLSIRVVLMEADGSSVADGTTTAALHFIKRGVCTEPHVAFAVEFMSDRTLHEVEPDLP
jgi:hypothetical protein